MLTYILKMLTHYSALSMARFAGGNLLAASRSSPDFSPCLVLLDLTQCPLGHGLRSSIDFRSWPTVPSNSWLCEETTVRPIAWKEFHYNVLCLGGWLHSLCFVLVLISWGNSSWYCLAWGQPLLWSVTSPLLFDSKLVRRGCRRIAWSRAVSGMRMGLTQAFTCQ